MTKPVRIKGTSVYTFNNCIIAKYLGGKNQNSTRWLVEKNGLEIAGDITTLWAAVDYIRTTGA